MIRAEEVAAMKSRLGYKGYVIVARSCELGEGEILGRVLRRGTRGGWVHGN